MTINDIARICYEAIHAYRSTLGENHDYHWDDAPNQQYCITDVKWRLANPDAPVSSQHDDWVKEKIKHGWSYGTVQNDEEKVHPCIVTFDKLPPEQRAKEVLFVGIVNGLRPFLSQEA